MLENTFKISEAGLFGNLFGNSVRSLNMSDGEYETAPAGDSAFDGLDFTVSADDAVGLAEKRLYPSEAKKIWNNVFARAGVTSPSAQHELKLKMMTYVIRNAYSVRAPYDKIIMCGNKEVPSVYLKDAVGPDMRRFCNDPQNVMFQWKIMSAPANKVLRNEQAKAWLITDERLAKFCWEGSLSLSGGELGSQDRTIIMDARKHQIAMATPYTRSAVGLASNNNPQGLRNGNVVSHSVNGSRGGESQFADYE